MTVPTSAVGREVGLPVGADAGFLDPSIAGCTLGAALGETVAGAKTGVGPPVEECCFDDTADGSALGASVALAVGPEDGFPVAAPVGWEVALCETVGCLDGCNVAPTVVGDALISSDGDAVRWSEGLRVGVVVLD